MGPEAFGDKLWCVSDLTCLRLGASQTWRVSELARLRLGAFRLARSITSRPQALRLYSVASPFSRTLRSLNGEPSKASFVGLVALVLLLALWLVWFLTADLPVYAASARARLEVEHAVHSVAALTAGRIVEVRAVVGQKVERGEILFGLDSELEQRRLEEENARRLAALKEVESLKVALATESQGLADTRGTRAAIDEAGSRYRAALAAAELAEEEATRSAQLAAQGLVSEMELRRVNALARERRAEAEASEQAVARLESERRIEGRDRQGRVDQIEREIVELEGVAETSAAAARRLGEEISRRLIRAPADGRLGEVATVRAGSVVAVGERLATLIPAAELKVVASFSPSDAMARVRPGQSAQLRLDGFPWTEFGSLAVEVSKVAEEAREGQLWVDGAVGSSPQLTIPLQHGMPGTLVIEIERVSPAELVLRAAGRAVTAGDGNRGPGG